MTKFDQRFLCSPGNRIQWNICSLAARWIIITNGLILILAVVSLSSVGRQAIGEAVGNFLGMFRGRSPQIMAWVIYSALVAQLVANMAIGWVMLWSVEQNLNQPEPLRFIEDE